MYRCCFVYIVLIIGICNISLYGQVDSIEQQFLEEYQKRITRSHINGFYIPIDIQDAMETLDETMDLDAQKKFAIQEENFAVRNSFFGFGAWLDLNWGLSEGSRLSHHIRTLGLPYPEDMRWLLMRCYHRHLNHLPMHVEDQIKHLNEQRARSKKND